MIVVVHLARVSHCLIVLYLNGELGSLAALLALHALARSIFGRDPKCFFVPRDFLLQTLSGDDLRKQQLEGLIKVLAIFCACLVVHNIVFLC